MRPTRMSQTRRLPLLRPTPLPRPVRPDRRLRWNTIYRRFRRWSEAGVWEAVAVTLAEIMADSGHYSIDSTTVRAMSRQRAEKGGLSTRSWPLAGRVHQ